MSSLFIRWILNALALFAVGKIIPGISVAGFGTALILVVVFGIINVTIRPLLIILTLPINIITLGLFSLVINGLLFWFVAGIIKGFQVESFWAAFLGALLYALVTSLINKYL